MQCGSNTWFKHFVTISGLDEECVEHLRSTGDKMNNTRMRMLLRVEGPRIFHVDDFARKNGLFTFTFVRHPFERLIRIKADNFDDIDVFFFFQNNICIRKQSL